MVTSSGLPDPISSSNDPSNPAASQQTWSPASSDGGHAGGSAAAPSTGGDGSAERSGNDMLARVVQGAHEAVDRLAETAAPHVQRLTQGVDSASGTLHHRADQVRDVSEEWTESLRVTVRENPLTALIAALAVGVIVARLTS